MYFYDSISAVRVEEEEEEYIFRLDLVVQYFTTIIKWLHV